MSRGDRSTGGLTSQDVKSISPIKLLIDKRKDLKLSDEQLKQIKGLEVTAQEQNDTLFGAIDSLRKEMRPPTTVGEPSVADQVRMKDARDRMMVVLGSIRLSYGATLKEALPLLDEAQQKTAGSLLEKQSREAEEMLREKLGGRGGRESGGPPPAAQPGRRRPLAG